MARRGEFVARGTCPKPGDNFRSGIFVGSLLASGFARGKNLFWWHRVPHVFCSRNELKRQPLTDTADAMCQSHLEADI